MMQSFEFSFIGLAAEPQGNARVHLRDDLTDRNLYVQIGLIDAQALAAELAGLQTTRSRLVTTVGRVAHSLNAQITQIFLEQSTGNVVEAQIILATDLDQISVPVSFGDSIALARALHLPIVGDASLTPLMQTAAAPEPAVELPSTIEAFLNTLSDV